MASTRQDIGNERYSDYEGGSGRTPREREQRQCDPDPHGHPDGPCTSTLDAERLSKLAGVIEGEIIPRLMMAHRANGHAVNGHTDAGVPVVQLQEEDIAEFTRLVLASEAAIATEFCVQLQQRSVATARILTDLLAPTARRLGEMWEADEVDFTAVTLGLCCLQQVLRDVSTPDEFDAQLAETPANRRLLLAPFPGEQHTFGLLMVGEFFRRAGWEVAGDCALTRSELIRMVGSEWYAIIGLSIAYDTMLPELAQLIESIRLNSRNTGVRVMVGGKVFADNPALAQEVGADATAADAQGAIQLAQELLVRCAVRN